jgi:TRAP-type C4-dicarboxylate transport system permease small subunit
LWGGLRLLMPVNTLALRVGRHIAWVALGLMVVIILIQVVFRYIFNNALPWPDEAARFLMLWMTGLIAPSAYRWGGFVSIEMVRAALPRVAAGLLMIVLLGIALLVLIVGLKFGLKHVSSGWLFASSSLKLPFDWVGGKVVPIKLAWMYMSLPVGLVLLIAVNVELILKALIGLFDPEAELPADPDAQYVAEAE